MSDNEFQSSSSNEDTDNRYVTNSTDYRYQAPHSERYADNYRSAYSNVYPGIQEPKGHPKKPRKTPPFLKKVIACTVLGLFFGFFTGVSFYAVKSVNTFIESKNSVEPVTGTADTAVAEGNRTADTTVQTSNNLTTVVTDVTQVVDEVMPSVVSITNMYIAKQELWGQTLQSPQKSGGSGIIVGENDKELLVATNYHVVQDADELHVQFIDGSEATAQIKGTNSAMDLAVVAVQLDTLSAETRAHISVATMGDSANLKVGEPAIAIGNALGYGQSVTTGVISAVDRSLTANSVETNSAIGAESTTSLIQTDAAINPGNSGGALLNIDGEVIGINSNKLGGTAIEGMGYAIPISAAKPILEDLMTKTTRLKVDANETGYLGISGVAVTEDVVATYGMPRGVLIAQIHEGGAAEAAGLVKGDIITKFDGSTVEEMQSLQNMLQYYKVGTQVELTISQGSPNGWQEKTVKVTLGAKPQQAAD